VSSTFRQRRGRPPRGRRVVRSFNKLKREEEVAPAAPPEPSTEEKLLGEIRDLLKEQA
jgi:large-conductance mechanosensitive channel